MIALAQANADRRQRVLGLILYSGPSVIDDQPIVAIATGLGRPSSNRKTGPMVQIWIMDADVNPFEAVASGADASVCGTCSYRGIAGRSRSCYVALKAPAQVWRTYRAGQYRALPLGAAAAVLRGRKVRLSAYGDPSAVPTTVWSQVLAGVDRRTGYTHRWRESPALAPYAMASCDTPAEQTEARSAGWRTFRVRLEGEALAAREIARASVACCAPTAARATARATAPIVARRSRSSRTARAHRPMRGFALPSMRPLRPRADATTATAAPREPLARSRWSRAPAPAGMAHARGKRAFRIGDSQMMKDPTLMSAGAINRELDNLDNVSNMINRELIAADRGNERHSETYACDDPLALRYRACSDRRYALQIEIEARYGPGAPSRLPAGRFFGPRKAIG